MEVGGLRTNRRWSVVNTRCPFENTGVLQYTVSRLGKYYANVVIVIKYKVRRSEFFLKRKVDSSNFRLLNFFLRHSSHGIYQGLDIFYGFQQTTYLLGLLIIISLISITFFHISCQNIFDYTLYSFDHIKSNNGSLTTVNIMGLDRK